MIFEVVFMKLIVLLTNGEITVLIEENWPQTERLVEYVNQSTNHHFITSVC